MLASLSIFMKLTLEIISIAVFLLGFIAAIRALAKELQRHQKGSNFTLTFVIRTRSENEPTKEIVIPFYGTELILWFVIIILGFGFTFIHHYAY